MSLNNFIYATFISLISCCEFCLAADAPDFSQQIQPILSDNCYQCHGPDEASREAELRLDQREGLLSAVGDTNDLSTSELIKRIQSDDPDEVMPPPDSNRVLNAEQKQLLSDWVASGANWEQHWSFVTPRRPALPSVKDGDWSTNAIDRFVLHGLESAGLSPSKPATPEKLLRRVTIDLTGLPPSLVELDAFLRDNESSVAHESAYRAAVEKMLASPRYGERMAMDWLDAARYADTNGYQGDNERTMWPWRDWVIQSFNQNQPYNEFTVWQLAGDLLPNRTDEQKLATGFCRNHMINGEGGRIAEENRIEYIFDQIETLGTVWMGLTVQCCRCHDHKFDPLAQSEYFKLFAFFNQTPVNGGGGDPQMAPNMGVPTPAQRQRLGLLREELRMAAEQLAVAESSVNREQCELPEELAKALETKPADRNDERWKQLETHFQASRQDSDVEFAKWSQAFRSSKKELDKLKRQTPKVMVMQDREGELRETFILDKGLYNQKRDKVTAGTPKFLPAIDGESSPNSLPPNRLSLARWLTSPQHPLTARVTVNRIWQTFFGTGLVKTTEDFGVQGEKPSHPELLDWLACELIESGWDTKQLVRLIVNSSTYRQSAKVDLTLFERDPENRLLARGPRSRLPSWMMRDQALAASGLLVGEIGGPSVKPYQPPGIWSEATFGKKKYNQDHGAALYRRSLYVYWRRIVGPTMFFDAPKRQTCSVKTSQTNTPLHALVTLNDTTYVEAARAMAVRLIDDVSASAEVSGAKLSGSELSEAQLSEAQLSAARITHAFRLCTSRSPNNDELEILVARLNLLRAHFAADPTAAEELLNVGEVKLNSTIAEFKTSSAEHAAYTTVCLLLLNLDEALNK